MEGWLEVETTLSNNTLVWKVLSEGGSGSIRNRVLRKALAGEADLVATGQGPRGALTLDNYEFASGVAGRIELRPRRRDTLLISGSALVSEENAELLEINGRLTKNPSFWTRDVDVRLAVCVHQRRPHAHRDGKHGAGPSGRAHHNSR